MTKNLSLALLFLVCLCNQLQSQTAVGSEQYKKETLPGTINTEFIEARPLISGDGNTLYFVRRYFPENMNGVKDFQDIYLSHYDSTANTWGAAENIGKTLNNKERNAVASVNQDGTEGIFFNTYRDIRKAPLVRSRKTDDGWSKPDPFSVQNFININDYADYHLDYRHNVLIMAIEGDITFGQQDLYISFPNGFGGWKEPVNLGEIINTPESEFSPFLASDGRSLFFCSYGHEGLGSSDIYMTVRLDDTWLRWSTPINLGPTINSNQEESYFSITDNFEWLYYTSHNARQTNRDIVRVKLPEDFTAINGPLLVNLDSAAISSIMLSGNYKVNPQGAKRNFQGVPFDGWPADDPIATTTTTSDTPATASAVAVDSTGTATTSVVASTTVPTGETSRYTGFMPANEATGLSPAAEEMKRYLQQKLPGLDILVKQEGNAVAFKIVQNMEYEFNSVFVTPEYLPRLRTIGNILKEKEKLNIELLGHTDDIGSDEVNNRVARQRVENIEYYLKRRAIAANRIEIVGLGNSEPLGNNDSESNKQRNRRVETILKFNP